MTGIPNNIESSFPVVSEATYVKDTKLRKVCADFESVFLHFILKSARKTVPQEGLLGNSNESRIYKSIMDEQMARSVSSGRGTGLGALLYEELKGNEDASSEVSENEMRE